MKILMVLTSHDQFGDTRGKTGFWLEEFASPPSLDVSWMFGSKATKTPSPW